MNDVSTLIIQDERTVLQSCVASSPAVVLFACYREEKTCWMACYQVAESERELTRGDGRGVAQATKRQGNLPDRALKVSVSSPEATAEAVRKHRNRHLDLPLLDRRGVGTHVSCDLKGLCALWLQPS